MAELHVDRILTLAQIKRDLEMHGPRGRIWVSQRTCWWTHHASHISVCPARPLIESDPWAFLRRVEANPGHYGRHGLDALVAAHHSNCRDALTGAPYASARWDDYNAALDALLEQEGALKRGKS
jgi:hypothetical protein